MVIIVKKITPKRCDVILIPAKPLNNMLVRHVARIGLAQGRGNTCIVTSKKDWKGKPSYKEVVKILLETVKKQKIVDGRGKYAIPQHLFHNLKCRTFDASGVAVSKTYNGKLVIDFKRIKGKGKLVTKEIQNKSYENMGPIERLKIKNTFKKIEGKCEKEFVFVVEHIHPALN
ncbi:hypothetical protein GOV03_03725 [Candidatus Woesearchaeota archaeon]|nr:hypothetical protein [Candidatus Woesearchaeota archaeon]